MKILIIIYLFTTLSSLNVSSISVDLTFGRGTVCYGRGLCSVDDPKEDDSKKPSLYFDEISTAPLRLDVPYGYLSKEDEIFQLYQDSIVVDKDIHLEISKFIESLILKKDTYPIHTYDEGFRIIF